MASENSVSVVGKARYFDECREAALEWLKANSTPNEWVLLIADETDRQLVIKHQTKDISFSISVTSNNDQLSFRVSSQNESVRSLLKTCKMDSIQECLESSITALGHYEDVSEENTEDDDDDVMDEDYYDNGEIMDQGDSTENNQGSGQTNPHRYKDPSEVSNEISEAELEMYAKSGSPMAVHRLLSDFKMFQHSNGMYGFRGSPRGDSLFVWDVQLLDFEKESVLGMDLAKYAKKFEKTPEIHLEMSFPNDYPMSPPFIRVIRPRFKFLTGHVTIGGSICMKLLTKSGWTPANDIESTLVQVRSAITSDPRASLDLTEATREYGLLEAEAAFKRMVTNHGWTN